MFIKVANDEIIWNYSIQRLRQDYPNTSFPPNISDEELETYNVFRLKELPSPEHNPITHKLVNQEPVLIDGVWTLARLAVEKTEQEMEVNRINEAQAVRSARQELLAASDWTQVADAPVDKAAWATYRQTLRDITLQEGFPLEVTWPEKP